MSLVDVKVTKKGGEDDVEEIGGKTVEIYEITAQFSQELASRQLADEVKQTVEYIVKYIGAVEVKLVDITYRKDYKWYPAHDNIPLASQLIVYRDRKYSNGKVFTDEFSNNLMGVTKYVCADLPSPWGGDSWIDREVTLSNGDKVFYHKNHLTYNDYERVITCKTGVRDTSTFLLRLDLDDYPFGIAGEKLEKYRNLNDAKNFTPENPVQGWYQKTIDRRQVSRFSPTNALNFLREHYVEILYHDRFFYIKDAYDERMIDFLAEQMTYEFNLQKESTKTPEGYPALVIKHDLKAKYLGKEFYVAVIDTIYEMPELQASRMHRESERYTNHMPLPTTPQYVKKATEWTEGTFMPKEMIKRSTKRTR